MFQILRVGDTVYMKGICKGEPDYDLRDLYIGKIYTIEAIRFGYNGSNPLGYDKRRVITFEHDKQKNTFWSRFISLLVTTEVITDGYCLVFLRPLFEEGNQRPYYLSQIELEVVSKSEPKPTIWRRLTL